jgi:hypothetical protein
LNERAKCGYHCDYFYDHREQVKTRLADVRAYAEHAASIYTLSSWGDWIFLMFSNKSPNTPAEELFEFVDKTMNEAN